MHYINLQWELDTVKKNLGQIREKIRKNLGKSKENFMYKFRKQWYSLCMVKKYILI